MQVTIMFFMLSYHGSQYSAIKQISAMAVSSAMNSATLFLFQGQRVSCENSLLSRSRGKF